MCQSARATAREDRYLFNQILLEATLSDPLRNSPHPLLFGHPSLSRALCVRALCVCACVCVSVRMLMLGEVRLDKEESPQTMAFLLCPLSPSICLVLALHFFFNLSLLLCSVEDKLAQAGAVVSRRAFVCVRRTEREKRYCCNWAQ